MKKRILSLLLALAVVFALLPKSALFAVSQTYSGTCGSDLQWDFDKENGTLTISGSGVMYDYDLADGTNLPPWLAHQKQILQVEIRSGVTEIGNFAFFGCGVLTDAAIPESVTRIGAYAFDLCESLTRVEIPDGVTELSEGVFYACKALSEVVLPQNVTRIGTAAFMHCYKLSGITLPSHLQSIEESAFSSCLALTELTIPDGVTHIGAGAFKNCLALERMVIPENVTALETEHQFYGCKALQSVWLPEHLERIGEAMFYDCTALSEIDLPTGLTQIGERAFKSCSHLQRIAIPETVTSIGAEAFCYDGLLQEVVLPERLDSMGERAFYGCSMLQCIVLPDGLPAVPDEAFCECTALQSLTLPSSAQSIGNAAFYGCSELTEVTIPDRVVRIGEAAFLGCRKLAKVTIPACVTQIEADAFTACRPDLTMYGYAGTAAERYAVENEITFSALGAALFADVRTDDWFYNAVMWATTQNPPITNGTDATHFSPTKRCTRAEVVMFLWNAAGKPEAGSDKSVISSLALSEAEGEARNPSLTAGTGNADFSTQASRNDTRGTANPFVDVSEDDWYYNAVMWAVANGITSGTDATHFAPTKKCTRAEVVMFLWNAAGKPEAGSEKSVISSLALSEDEGEARNPFLTAETGDADFSTQASRNDKRGSNPFDDVPADAWYVDAVLWAVAEGITSGTTPTTFAPTKVCTRAEVVQFLYKAAQ